MEVVPLFSNGKLCSALAQHEQYVPSVETRAARHAVVACPSVIVGSGWPSLGVVVRHKDITTDNKNGRSCETLWSPVPGAATWM